MSILQWKDGKFYIIVAVGGYMSPLFDHGFDTMKEAEDVMRSQR